MSGLRRIRGALYGSLLVTLPHVAPEVERLRKFVSGEAPVLVEVGFDHGRRLQSTARCCPEWRVVGLEVRERRVAEATARARRDGLDNVLAWRMDARIVFASVLPEASVDVVEVLFPTPWWNPAHRAKRLLVTDEFLADVVRALRPGGLFHVATDVEDYADRIDACVTRCDDLELVADDEGRASRPDCNQLSRREWACERDAVPVHRRYARRR
jgi:tRNA (guanine-N7-)-methyltransferase